MIGGTFKQQLMALHFMQIRTMYVRLLLKQINQKSLQLITEQMMEKSLWKVKEKVGRKQKMEHIFTNIKVHLQVQLNRI